MFLIDSHCHLDGLNYNDLHKDVDAVLDKARECGVQHFLSVGVTLTRYQALKALVGHRRDVSLSCGVHPLDLDEPFDAAAFRELAAEPQVVAIGETGLDYFYSEDTVALQQEVFREHIRTARAVNKPLIIHTRDAREDTLRILREEQAQECCGVIHCFTEDADFARQAMELGFYISVSGIITFRNAEALREAIREVPLERLLVETDSPYLAPVPHRGKENQPAFVRDVAEYLAVLKGVSVETLAQATTDNFCRLFATAQVERS
ncbi:YchF/TatD family DNA exonuclease [Plesiomonas shigelloides]|uniref:YchF/TatD family DNA exonuclease n=1 Tax=Plesiomonas shigelloides TaxID=703 RepID=UPI001C5BF0A7|nr:YchF/TatD family DNA exonuclease [Plesiomonas shigelloides]MBW3792803.1 YchF/TatD family DNA exonuclease [Plesiomonas shigelloides]